MKKTILVGIVGNISGTLHTNATSVKIDKEDVYTIENPRLVDETFFPSKKLGKGGKAKKRSANKRHY